MARQSTPETTITMSTTAANRFREAAQARDLPVFAFMEVLSLTAKTRSLRLTAKEERELAKDN